jgi:hypothetical protein
LNRHTCAALAVLGFVLVLLAQTAGAEGPAVPNLKFTIPEHDLYPENIAFDPQTGDFYLGSMSRNRILRIHADGSYEDFVAAPDCGLLSSVGMKVDAKRRLLWVCSGRFTLYADYDSAPARTGLIAFDLETGRPAGEWLLDQESDYHIFNDVAVASGGEVYATTTLIGAVYRVRGGEKKMTLVHQLEEGRHNNGIALGPHEKYLFLTIDRSIFRLEPVSGELVELTVPGGESLGTDGLYFHDGSLVAVKPRFNRISRLFLDEGLTTAGRTETLAQDHEGFAYPTTGVVTGTSLVFVGTSYANVPRNPDSPRQHGDVLIFETGL